RGRVAHESIFNVNDGHYRCPNSQQGYSPFSTWTRGLAWAILGFAEQLEFVDRAIKDEELETWRAAEAQPQSSSRSGDGRSAVMSFLPSAAEATADFYLEQSCVDGVPLWDTAAPNLHRLGDYRRKAADPYNAWQPVA